MKNFWQGKPFVRKADGCKFSFFHHMEVLLCVLFLFLGATFLTSCQKESGPGDDDPAPQVPQLPSGVDLNEKTLQITDIQTESLKSADEDNSTLYFDSSLPESQVPSVGQILLQFAPTEKLPYGFLGKVSSVKKTGQGITVETEAVDLDEAFDKLEISVDMDLTPTEEAGVKSMTKDQGDGVAFVKTFTEEDVIGDDDSNIKMKTSVSMGGAITVSAAVDKSKNQNDITVNCSLLLGFEFGLDVHIEKEGDFSYKLGKPIPIRTPSSIAIQPSIQFYIVTEYTGSMDMSYNCSSNCVYPFTFGRKNGVLYNNFNKETMAGKEVELKDKPEITTESLFSLNMEGSLYFGLVPEISFKLFGRNSMKLTAMPSLGYEYSGEVDIEVKDETGTGDNVDGDKDETIYQMLKDEHLTSSLQCGINFGINFFNLKGETDFDRYTIIEEEKYLFPKFASPDKTVNDNYTRVSTKVERDLLFPLEIGLGLYDKETLGNGLEVPVSKSASYEYFFNEGFANPLSASFNVSETQSVYPYITVGKQTIRADWNHDIVGKWRVTHTKGGCLTCMIDFSYDWEKVDGPDEDMWWFQENGVFKSYDKAESGWECDWQCNYTINGDSVIQSGHDEGGAWTWKYKILQLDEKTLILLEKYEEDFRPEGKLHRWEEYWKLERIE